MRKYLLATFMITIMLIAIVPAVSAEDQTSNRDLILTGQISHGGDPQATTNPITIKIYELNESTDILKYVTEWKNQLDKDGMFRITMNYESGKIYCIEITEDGFKVFNWTSCMTQYEDSIFKIIFGGEPENTFSLTERGHYIVMTSSHGSVTGKIQSSSGSKPYLNGINVILTNSTTNKQYTKQTSGNGEYTFNDVETGEYELTAEGKGFSNYVHDEKIVVNPGKTKEISIIEMKPTNETNTSHMMTIGGAICALALLACVVFYIVRYRKA